MSYFWFIILLICSSVSISNCMKNCGFDIENNTIYNNLRCIRRKVRLVDSDLKELDRILKLVIEKRLSVKHLDSILEILALKRVSKDIQDYVSEERRRYLDFMREETIRNEFRQSMGYRVCRVYDNREKKIGRSPLSQYFRLGDPDNIETDEYEA